MKEETLEELKFKESDKKKVYSHAKKAGLKIHGFVMYGSFTVLIIPLVKKDVDSYLIRNDFLKSYHKFLDAMERNNLLQVVSIYKRIDKISRVVFNHKK